MMLGITNQDRKALYGTQREIAYMHGQINRMSDQYPHDEEEAAAISDVGLKLHIVLVALDNILCPD